MGWLLSAVSIYGKMPHMCVSLVLCFTFQKKNVWKFLFLKMVFRKFAKINKPLLPGKTPISFQFKTLALVQKKKKKTFDTYFGAGFIPAHILLSKRMQNAAL